MTLTPDFQAHKFSFTKITAHKWKMTTLTSTSREVRLLKLRSSLSKFLNSLKHDTYIYTHINIIYKGSCIINQKIEKRIGGEQKNDVVHRKEPCDWAWDLKWSWGRECCCPWAPAPNSDGSWFFLVLCFRWNSSFGFAFAMQATSCCRIHFSFELNEDRLR